MTVPGRSREGAAVAPATASASSEGPRRPQGSRRPVQKAAGLAVHEEKVSHLLLQLSIPAAGPGDIAVPLPRRQLADGVQE